MMKRLALLAGLTLALCCTVAAAAPAPIPDTEPACTDATMTAAPAAHDVAVADVFVLQYRQAECVFTSTPIATVPGLVFASFSPTSARAPVEVRPSPTRPGDSASS